MVVFLFRRVCAVCVHPVAVLNAAFCVILSLLIFDDNERADHMDKGGIRKDPARWRSLL